ncbi:MAG: hypothetical protein GY862_23850, partial [Gammaproteobacteria bacterium]|nr:hypothetical protein [Gammaproteobacteria bacterium]
MKTIFDICTPRKDVLKKGALAEADFAADLAQVLKGNAPEEYKNPAIFFSNTHPTHGLKELLHNVCARLSAHSRQIASIFRLDTQYGGGKTHALIALSHIAKRRFDGVNIAEFIDPALIPKDKVRIAAFDGENADP